MHTDKNQKLADLKEKLKKWEDKLAWEMKTYRGVIHESAASEIKHDKVMVLKDMVLSLQQEIMNLEKQK